MKEHLIPCIYPEILRGTWGPGTDPLSLKRYLKTHTPPPSDPAALSVAD